MCFISLTSFVQIWDEGFEAIISRYFYSHKKWGWRKQYYTGFTQRLNSKEEIVIHRKHLKIVLKLNLKSLILLTFQMADLMQSYQ